MKSGITLSLTLVCLLSFVLQSALARATIIGQYGTLELTFHAASTPANPYDTYLLKLEVTDPAGRTIILDGFYDGNGKGGQDGTVWKARICPYMTGTWRWRTVPGDSPDSGLAGQRGQFVCRASNDLGGVIRDGQFFRFQRGEYIFLQGNFLDALGGTLARSTHTFMSEMLSDQSRAEVLWQQRYVHHANKINVYFANKGDYEGIAVTPWLGSADNNDKTRMDLGRWKNYDAYLRSFKENRMLAEMWFFADDSNFGDLSEADKKRLFRYAMARTSAYSHTLYVIALEWDEGWTEAEVNSAGNYLQAHNPWGRILSVHNQTDWAFSGQSWPGFIATQAGNDSDPAKVNQLARTMRANEPLPHLSEEFGILTTESDSRLRANAWANLLGGAAGGGTGSDLKSLLAFLAQSRMPFWRMESANHLLTDGDAGTAKFCLADPGHHYAVYTSNGSFTLDVSGTNLRGFWYDPTNPAATLGSPFPVTPGRNVFTPPQQEMVLWLTDGTNLGNGITHPTGTTRPSSILFMLPPIQ